MRGSKQYGYLVAKNNRKGGQENIYKWKTNVKNRLKRRGRMISKRLGKKGGGRMIEPEGEGIDLCDEFFLCQC